MKYRPEIDGLRTVAVVPVILFHAGFGLFSGGFVGVDVFFVISGYLITTILIDDLERGQFSILKFYDRRARRILPALFLVMLCSIPFAWFWMLPDQLSDFANSLVAVSLFVSNILFWQESGYFAPAAELKPLLHTWSLAVEEQYYLLFPVFLFLVWRFGRDRVFWMIAAMAAVSLLLCEIGWRRAPSANFYLAPTRAWEIFAGSIAALVIQKRGVRSNDLFAIVGLAGIVASIFLYDAETPFPSLFALVPVLGAVLIVLFGGPGTLVARVLSVRVMVGIGLISYSAYLWHQPLLAFARLRTIHEPPLLLMGSLGLLSLALAYLSWRFVERPFRAGPHTVITRRPVVFASSLVGMAAFVLIGFGARDGMSERFTFWYDRDAAKLTLPLMEDGYCFRDFQTYPEMNVQNDLPDCRLGDETRPSTTLLFGDSLAAHWEPFFDLYGQENGVAFDVLTTNWCFPTFTEDSTAKRGHIARTQCRINRDHVRERASSYDNIVLSGQWAKVEERGFTTGVLDMIDEMLSDPTLRVVLIATPPQYSRGSVERAYYRKGSDLLTDETSEAGSAAFWKQAVTRFGENPAVTLLSPANFGDQFAVGGYQHNGIPYSLDGTHISVGASRALYLDDQSRISERLNAILKPGSSD